jgi:hypothetical protein
VLTIYSLSLSLFIYVMDLIAYKDRGALSGHSIWDDVAVEVLYTVEATGTAMADASLWSLVLQAASYGDGVADAYTGIHDYGTKKEFCHSTARYIII